MNQAASRKLIYYYIPFSQTCPFIYFGPVCYGKIQDNSSREEGRNTRADETEAPYRIWEGKRQETVIYGGADIKYNPGYKRFLLRSLGKVRGEFKLMCIGYNLRKIFSYYRMVTAKTGECIFSEPQCLRNLAGLCQG